MNTQTIKPQRSIVIEPDNGLITVDDNPAQLEPLLMRMLLHFINHQGQLVTRKALIEEVWLSKFASDEAINIGVSRLRKVLGGQRQDFISTLPRKGYQFNLPQTVNFKVDANSIAASSSVNGSVSQPWAKNTSQRLKYPMMILATVILLSIGVQAGFQVLWSDITEPAKQKDAKAANSTPPIPIELATIQVNVAGQSAPQSYQQSIYGLLKAQLQLSHKLDFNAPTDDKTVVRLSINNLVPNLHLSVVIENKSKNSRDSSDFEFASGALDGHIKRVVNEIAAYTRLMLLYSEQDKPLLRAYKPLSYLEVEQLVTARQYTTWRKNDKIAYAYETVSTLNKKYPDVPQITGLLSRLESLRVGYDSVDIVEEKRQELSNAKATLASDPSNFDALISAFSFHRNFAPLRDKAKDYAQALRYHHPRHPGASRAQLLIMADNMMSCDKITAFVDAIEPGVFKAHRLKVIKQILDTCIHQLPGQIIHDQLSFLPNSKADKAIIKNLLFFRVRYDKIWLPDSRNAMVFNGAKYNTVYLMLQLMRGDRQSALIFLQKIMASKNRYWQWFAQLYMALYEPLNPEPSSNGQALWRNDYYQLLHSDAEMHFAALHVKQQTTNPASAQRIEQYLAQRPAFAVNIMNRKESIAKIMLLHHGGRIEAAKSAANQLYRQLEQNFQTSPNSFRFWSLGRYHLIAKLYCAQACQQGEQSPEQYLTQMFSPHHIWWLDDLKVMEQALKPWSKSPLVEQYLQQVKADLARMQRVLGIK